MTTGPGEPDVRKETGEPEAPSPGREAASLDPDARPPSPFRIVFAIVPLLVIAIVATNLLGLWTTSIQETTREETLGEPEPSREETFGVPAPVAEVPAKPAFDAAAVVARVADADLAQGAAAFRMCSACHPGEKNAPPKIAPNLWGVLGRAKAATPGYAYSAALKAKGGTWTYEDLADYLHNPREFAPGTSMAFAGISDNARMANLIAHLRALSDAPLPLPDKAR